MSNLNIYKELVHKTFEFLELRDIDLLLEKILEETRKFLNADAGTIYIVEEGKLFFKYAQNESLKKDKTVKYKTFSLPIDNTSIAGFCANNDVTLNIEDVYLIDDRYPYRFNKNFDKISGYRTKSMLVAPLHSFDGKVIGVIQIINKLNEKGEVIPFNKTDEKLIIKYFSTHASFAIEKAIQTKKMILKMIEMARLRDPQETGAHVQRVGSYSIELYEFWAKEKKIPEEEILKTKDILKLSAMLHDVGKVAIPDKILKKPGKLTKEEFDTMKLHTIYGANLFKDKEDKFEKACHEVALSHHERWDGKGYPYGKKEEEIPLFGRIVAIADVFDALMSKRSYKEPFSFEKVVKIITENSKNQFDPELVEYFLEISQRFKQIHSYFKD